MNTLEIIHLRLAGEDAQSLVDLIRKSADAALEPTHVHIYRHSTITTDLVVHLHWNITDDGEHTTSDLGARLASVLREHAMVEHSVWQELP